jgi:hypothetical protein
MRRGDASDLQGGLTPPHELGGYSFVADGIRGALIDNDGGLAWMSFPGWADPAVFAGLLGARGAYSVVPQARRVASGFYEDGTLIWHSRCLTEGGVVDCRDALGYPGERDRVVVLRRVTAIGGSRRMTSSPLAGAAPGMPAWSGPEAP